LQIAIGNNKHPQVVIALIKAGADVNARYAIGGGTVLMVECEKSGKRAPNPEIINSLLEAGADVNIKTPNGKKAIDFFNKPVPESLKEVYEKIKAATTVD
jgi:uncharacterized protein YlzI (FlbEa/FlbD family)